MNKYSDSFKTSCYYVGTWESGITGGVAGYLPHLYGLLEHYINSKK